MKIQENLSGICFENGYKALQEKGLAIIGMSPGNGYFKQQIIHDLIGFASQEFKQVCIWVPDMPAEHTYKALGYTPKAAQQKARQKGNNLKNHSARAIMALNDRCPITNCCILDWNMDIEPQQSYQEQLKYTNQLYVSNQEFYKDVRTDTAVVIEGYNQRKQIVSECVLDEGAQYLLKEIAFFLASEALLRSSGRVTLIYHKPWPLFEKFFAGYYDAIQRNIGLLLVTP